MQEHPNKLSKMQNQPYQNVGPQFSPTTYIFYAILTQKLGFDILWVIRARSTAQSHARHWINYYVATLTMQAYTLSCHISLLTH